jgi:hypothetical protein
MLIPKLNIKNDMNTPNQSRIRPDDVLGNLSEEDQAQILAWLEEMTYAAAVRQIAQPRPEGLDIKTHVTSLRRFYERHESESLLDSHAPSLWREPINQIVSNPINFRPVLMQTLEREALLALNRMQDNPKLAIQLLDRLIRLRNLDLKERKTARTGQGADDSALSPELLALLGQNQGSDPSEEDPHPDEVSPQAIQKYEESEFPHSTPPPHHSAYPAPLPNPVQKAAQLKHAS